ncbi:MAG: hypothetical protein K1X55_10415 [Chitinophagales bacterium]|nr:hypothetical protein [Chitinophagales bacterium]
MARTKRNVEKIQIKGKKLDNYVKNENTDKGFLVGKITLDVFKYIGHNELDIKEDKSRYMLLFE